MWSVIDLINYYYIYLSIYLFQNSWHYIRSSCVNRNEVVLTLSCYVVVCGCRCLMVHSNNSRDQDTLDCDCSPQEGHCDRRHVMVGSTADVATAPEQKQTT